MSHQASAGFHVSEQFTTLTLVGGRDCIPGALLSHQSPDLWVKGGAIIEKTLCVGGNIIADGYIIGNTCADVSLTGKIQEKYLNEGINIKGDIRDNCGNIFDVGYLSVQTIAASNACGQGNIIYMGNDVRIFGDLEVGANLIVYQDTILEQELHVVGQSFFSGNMIAGHIDAVSICTPLLECVQEITGPGTLVIAPKGNITDVYGKLNVDNLCVSQDTYFFGNVFGLPPSMVGVSTFSAGTTGFLPNAPAGGSVVLSGTLNAASGGTGQSLFVVGDLLYADTTTTLARLADVAVGSVLASNGVGAAPVWSNVTNAMLANSSLTVSAGSGLSGGGSVSLGGTVTLTNDGVTSAVAGTGISVSASTGAVTISNTGVTSVLGGSGISVSASNGSVTITSTGTSGVSTFSAGTTGFSPNSATAGAVVLSGTLNAASGGTGQSLFVVGDLLYADTTTTLARLADVAVGSVLASNGVGAAPVWSNVTNAMLANSSLTVSAGSGLSGGGSVSLGGTVTLTNDGVTSAVAGTGISVSASTGAVTISNTGVTSVIGGSGISVSASNGSVTITSTGTSGVSTFSAGTTGFSPNSATAGAVVLSGTLNVANGGTGLTATPTTGQILVGNGSGYTLQTGVVLDSAASPTYPQNLSDGVWYGLNTKANSLDSSTITIGNGATTNTVGASNSIAVGVSANANGANGVAVGNSSNAGVGCVSVGLNCSTSSTSVAIGSGSSAVTNGVSIGFACSSASTCVSIGNSASCSNGGSVAIGNNANTGAANSIAIGVNADTTTGSSSVAIGRAVVVNSNLSIGIGDSAFVDSSAVNNISIGVSSKSYFGDAVAIGNDARAYWRGVSIGLNANATAVGGTDVIAIGTRSFAGNNDGISIGRDTINAALRCIVIGVGAQCNNSNGVDSIAIGNGALNTVGISTIAIGKSASVAFDNGIAIGNTATASVNSVSIGYLTTCSGMTSQRSVAIGDQCTCTNIAYSVAIGRLTTSTGDSAVAIGNTASAAFNCVSIGVNTSSTSSSVAIGANAAAVVSGTAIGRNANSALNSFAGGNQAAASADQTVAIGNSSSASTAQAVSIGSSTTASGGGSVVVGANGSAAGIASIAIGETASATTNYSIALGQNADVINVDNGIAIGQNAASNDWVMNTSGPLAVTTHSSAVPTGPPVDITGGYTIAPTRYLRIRLNGVNYTMPLYADQ